MEAANSNSFARRSGRSVASRQVRQRTSATEGEQPKSQPKSQPKLQTKQPPQTNVRLPAGTATTAPSTTRATTTTKAKTNAQARTTKNKMAGRQNANKSKCKTAGAQASPPLELLVVGHQLHIHPMPMPPAPMRSNLIAQMQHYGEATNHTQQFMEDGEFVYIYETSWPPQLKLPNEFQQPLTLAQQVVDSRFLAELMDELLIRDT
ncbi:hypothetical protein KR093_002875 [Drosophila rubida]|uniref:Uncharacterized protein n=1 Tax=Drosophila rubida TaxID=30044 RepID=A0AAD4KC99_9MUSC|nr:hypothetical protein KR093_002875 [Drosophila rubida]